MLLIQLRSIDHHLLTLDQEATRVTLQQHLDRASLHRAHQLADNNPSLNHLNSSNQCRT